MTDKALLDRLGIDPQTVVAERKRHGKITHAAVFDACGKIVEQTIDFCKAHGFGNATRLHVMQATTEPGLYAVAMCVSYPPDVAKFKPGEMPFENTLFAALFVALSADYVSGTLPSNYKGREMEAAHTIFQRITGKVFRDCFIETCSCTNCKNRRKIHGIKFNPDKMDRWL